MVSSPVNRTVVSAERSEPPEAIPNETGAAIVRAAETEGPFSDHRMIILPDAVAKPRRAMERLPPGLTARFAPRHAFAIVKNPLPKPRQTAVGLFRSGPRLPSEYFAD